MNQYANAYIKAVNKEMRCSRGTKNHLLHLLAQNIERFTDENENICMQVLCDSFGSPADMAQQLMQEVTPEQQKSYYLRKKTVRIFSGVLSGILVFAMIYIFFIKQKPVIVSEEIIEDGIIYSDELSDD